MRINRSSWRRMGLAGLVTIALVSSACIRSPEAKSAKFMAEGKRLLEQKDPARAILQFRNAAQTTPRNPEAYYQLALASLAAGDIQQGLIALQKTLSLNPKHAGAEVELSRLMVATNDGDLLKQARGRLQSLLADDRDDPDVLQVLALSELKLGSPEEAAQHLERAVATAPQNLVIVVTLAQAKLSQNDTKGAEEVLKGAVAASPESADAAIMLGRLYMGLKRYGEAEGQFRRAISLDANSGTALLNLAVLENETGKKSDAEQTLLKLSHFPDPNSKAAHANFLFSDGRRDEAVKEFEEIVKAFPENRQARTRLVAAYNSMNREVDARRILDAVLKKNPKDADALVQRAELSIGSGKFTQAENDLNLVLRQQANSAEIHYILARLRQAQGSQLRYRAELATTVDLNPYLEPARVELAQLLTSMNQGGAALDVINHAPESQRASLGLIAQRNWANWAIGDMPAMRKGIDQGLVVQRSPELLIQDGMWKLRSGDPTGARKAIEEALRIDPTDLRALQTLRQTYLAQKNAPVALQKVKEYALRQPKSAPVQEFLGVLLAADGDRREARVAFEAAKAADPKFVTADLSLIQLEVIDNKLDDAQRRLQSVLSVDRSNTTARLWLGNIEITKGDRKSALEDFRQVVAADPNNTQALNNYAYLLSELNPTEALKYAQKAKELAPGDAAYSDTLGWVLYSQGLYSLAVSELERAAGQVGHPVWKYHLAMAYAKAGNTNRSQTMLQSALKLNPNLPEATMAQQVLETAKQ
jgi:tetratricopeptide (TPR) repeat protein